MLTTPIGLLLVLLFVCNGEKRLLVNDAGYMATELQTLKAIVTKLTSDQLALRQDYEARIHNLSSTVTRLQSEVDRNKQHVAFYATLSAHHDLGQEQTIEFDSVMTNIGNHYNGMSGIFTVPFDGLYQFSTTSFSAASADLHTQLMLNTQVIGNNYGNSHSSSATINVPITAKAGNIIYVRHTQGVAGQKVHGIGYSSFSGFLIE